MCTTKLVALEKLSCMYKTHASGAAGIQTKSLLGVPKTASSLFPVTEIQDRIPNAHFVNVSTKCIECLNFVQIPSHQDCFCRRHRCRRSYPTYFT